MTYETWTQQTKKIQNLHLFDPSIDSIVKHTINHDTNILFISEFFKTHSIGTVICYLLNLVHRLLKPLFPLNPMLLLIPQKSWFVF